MTIVTHVHRPKRAPRWKPNAQDAAIAGPAIVTIRRKNFADVPDMSPEEYQRRGDAADALWRELVRRVRER